MGRFIRYLTRHRIVAAVFLGLYAGVIIVTHDHRQKLILWLEDLFEPTRWRRGAATAGIAAAVWAGAWLLVRLRGRPDAWLIGGYALATFALAVAAATGLVLAGNQYAHLFQYALLALLVFPLTHGFGPTVIACTLIGAFDEGYQYVVLHAHWATYYDFNDVILNLLGAAFGVIAIRAALPPTPARSLSETLRLPDIRFAGVFLASVGVASLAGLIRILPDQNTLGLVLRRSGPSSADWIVSEFGKCYHELQPAEAGLLIMALWALYLAFDVIPARREYPIRAEAAAQSEAGAVPEPRATATPTAFQPSLHSAPDPIAS